jgi:xylulokinase
LVFGLTLSHSRADLYRALLESVGYSIRHNIEALAEEGCRPERILAVGGGTRNPAWMQMVSDIAGITQVIPAQQIGAAYGDAFLAGIGAGLFSGIGEAGRWIQPGSVMHPRPEASTLYDRFYGLYRELYERNAGAMHSMGAILRQGECGSGSS